MHENENEDTKCCCEGSKKDTFIEQLFAEYQPIKDNLIQMLNEIQEHYGYVPMEVQKDLSEFLSIPMAEIYGVVTFYSRFSLKPKGKYNISVCMGTACYVKGSQKILDRLLERLKIRVRRNHRRWLILNRRNKMCWSLWFSTCIHGKRRSIWKSYRSKIRPSIR